MIKLTRPVLPAQLTPQTTEQLTATYLANRSERVWAQKYIQDALLAMSHKKCAYCETRLQEEAKYLEVEHYRCKKDFPHLVVQWDNLLPSCKRCNGHKSEHNVETEGDLIDPAIVDPRDHFRIINYRLHPKTANAKRAIDVIYLNDSERVVKMRYDIGNAIGTTLDRITADFELWVANDDVKFRRRVERGIVEVLREGQPESAFAATAATAILQCPQYQTLTEGMKQKEIWTADLDQLEQAVRSIALL